MYIRNVRLLYRFPFLQILRKTVFNYISASFIISSSSVSLTERRSLSENVVTVLTEPAPTQLLDKIVFKKSGTYNRLLAKSPFSSPFSSLRRINLKITKDELFSKNLNGKLGDGEEIGTRIIKLN